MAQITMNFIHMICLLKKFEVFSEFPGKLRNQAVSYVYNNELYVYGGGASETYNDGFKLNLETKEWTSTC